VQRVWFSNINKYDFCWGTMLFQYMTEAGSPSVVSVTTAASSSDGKDTGDDEELFDFLNNSSPSAVSESLKFDGRPSSSALTQSQKTSPELFVAEVGATNDLLGAVFV